MSITASLGPVVLVLACAAALPAQTDDVDRLERELVALFERPAGRPISAEQKAALGDWLATHDGRLGRLGYARGLHSYLTRDVDKAVDELDAFFAEHDNIRADEHRLMAGRIYMSAFIRLARTADPEVTKLSRYGERATRLYADLPLLGRYMPRALGGLEDPEVRAAARVALARGALASAAPAGAQDVFLRAIYADASAPAPAPRAAGRGADADPTDPSAAVRAALTGKKAPALAPELVLNADGDALPGLAGKVVLIDFWATWCGPCRAVIPDLVELQAKHGGALQVVGATRFYGYGADFSGPGAKPPHGGAKVVRDLDREGEVAINRTFADVFALNYPIAFVAQDVFARYGVRGIPTVFVVGRDGKVVGHVVGSQSHDELRRLLERALRAG